MLFQRFFKQPKPNKFGYTPVFYDERKIERERKIKEAKTEGKEEYQRSDSLNFRSGFKSELERNRENSINEFRAKGKAKSNKTLFIIMFLIAALIYVQLKFL